MLKFGIVTQIDESKCLARVQFADLDETVSYWLPVAQTKTLNDKFYVMPDIEEHVVCLMDENLEEGVILASIYSEADTAPVFSKDKFYVKFKDETYLEYDREEHKLTAIVKGEADITVEEDITVDAQKKITVTSAEDIAITGNQKINISATSDITVHSDTKVYITAPSVYIGGAGASATVAGNISHTGSYTLIGNLAVTGNITASGDILADGSNSNHHSH